ncbi:MAG: chlorite dismutase family protein [Verrucomicrobia bacterium]|nr:chlorite dismutase family protein [Verrucomicrobiota bacterium]
MTATDRTDFTKKLCAAVSASAERAYFYQVFPARSEYDFLIWTTQTCEELTVPDSYFKKTATAYSPFRQHIAFPTVLCGITKPSLYTGGRPSPQEIDALFGTRQPYFVIYPFAKTPDWYLKSREERQELMNSHITVGRKFPTIQQLLLYSFGIQDQEFIVAYEMEDLPLFSDLVQELRSTTARIYTLLDTPIITGMLRTPEALSDVFAGH